jgi:hypothetical protein
VKEDVSEKGRRFVEMDTAAFKAEGAQLRDQFQGQVVALLGPERSEAFWQQAAPAFRNALNDFGAYKRYWKLVSSGPTGPLTLFDHYRSEGSARELTQLTLLKQLDVRPLPPALQIYADAWHEEIKSASLKTQRP